MLTDEQLADAAVAAGTNRRETPEERAVRLLRTLLPTFRSRDHALESLYLMYPDANQTNIIQSVAAAIYILGSAE